MPLCRSLLLLSVFTVTLLYIYIYVNMDFKYCCNCSSLNMLMLFFPSFFHEYIADLTDTSNFGVIQNLDRKRCSIEDETVGRLIAV